MSIRLTNTTAPAAADFSSLTFSGPFLRTADLTIGTAGTALFGVAIKPVGADEPIHNLSGSIM